MNKDSVLGHHARVYPCKASRFVDNRKANFPRIISQANKYPRTAEELAKSWCFLVKTKLAVLREAGAVVCWLLARAQAGVVLMHKGHLTITFFAP